MAHRVLIEKTLGVKSPIVNALLQKFPLFRLNQRAPKPILAIRQQFKGPLP